MLGDGSIHPATFQVSVLIVTVNISCNVKQWIAWCFFPKFNQTFPSPACLLNIHAHHIHIIHTIFIFSLQYFQLMIGSLERNPIVSQGASD